MLYFSNTESYTYSNFLGILDDRKKKGLCEYFYELL